LSGNVKEMLLMWEETDVYFKQPDEVSRKKQLKVVWFTYFRVIASIYLEAGEASAADISQNLSIAISARAAYCESKVDASIY
jgi:hypothetical protein